MNTSTPSNTLPADVAELGPWFHNIHLPDGTQTAPDHPLGDFPAHLWHLIEPHIPADLTGATVLDIGCNAGFYSAALATRGANVLAIDHDQHYLTQARWVTERLDLQDRVELRLMDVYDLHTLGDRRFDYVWFMGVFYHLRYPLLGLDLVTQRVGGTLVFQSLTMPGRHSPELEIPQDCDINDRQRMLDDRYPKIAFIEHRLAHDPTNWWTPNTACIDAMLRSCGMRITSRPSHEVALCSPDPNAQPAKRPITTIRVP